MRLGWRGSFRRTPGRMIGRTPRRLIRRTPRRMIRRTPRRMIRRTPRRTPRRPVPRTGSRLRAPARQAAAARLRGKFRHALPFRRAAPDGSCPAGRTRRPVPRTGSRRRAPARQVPSRAPLPASLARRVVPRRPYPATGPADREPPPRPRAASRRHALPFRRASPGGSCPSVAPGARRAPRPFRDAACPPQVQIKNIETASIRVSCDLRPLETLAFCAAAQDLGRCPKPRQGAKGSVSPVGCCAQRKATRSAPEGSVSPVGCCAQRKATRRCEQIQGLRAAAAQNADICERQGSANG